MHFFTLLPKIILIQKYLHTHASEKAKDAIQTLKNSVSSEVLVFIEPILSKMISCDFESSPISQFTDVPDIGPYGSYFNYAVYLTLLDYAKLAFYFEKNGIPEEQALKLAVVFGEVHSALKYLMLNKSFHDACLFQLPQAQDCQFAHWQKYAKKYMKDPRFKQLLPLAHEIEKLMHVNREHKPNYQQIDYKKKEIAKIHHQWKQLKRKHGSLDEAGKSLYQNLNVALLCHKETLVSLCQNIAFDNVDLLILHVFYEHFVQSAKPEYRYFLEQGLTDKDYDKFIKLNRHPAGKNLPAINLSGEVLGDPNLYLIKVPIEQTEHAARAACFGKLTNCCQSLSGEAGESCTIHGLTSPHGGFYIVCRGDSKNPNVTDELLAQCWAWRSERGAIVFDSIEISAKVKGVAKKHVIGLYQELGKQMVDQGYTHKVCCGTSSGISPEVGISPVFSTEEFIDYVGYTDSKEQAIIYDKSKPFYWYTKSSECKIITEHMLTEAFDSSLPLAKSKCLETILNWAKLYRQNDLLLKVKEIAESVGRLEEMQFLLDSIGYFEANCLDINSLYLQKKPSLDFEKIIKLIQEHKFFINTQNQDGTTVLILAANQGLVPVVRALLNLGADLHMANMHGSALTWAIVGAQNKRNFTMHKVIELLIQHGLDPNQGINQSVPALIQATELNLLPIVTKLLDLNIDINVKDHTGKTALMVASSLGHDNIVLELMENGVDLHATDASCSNALMYAVINQHEDIVNELAENGINLNAQNNNGYTALMLAVDLGFVDIAKLLLEHNADPNVKDPSGKTALVIAAQKHCSSVITALLLAGADDIEALHYLSSKGMIQEKQFIEKHIRKANVKQANVIFSQRQPSDAQLNETQSATGSKKLQP